MHITELRLAGFKSFVDPVRAPIEAGLTGVVGPNGCGKSNLLEAVRWVMGAASAKAMRAADMDDVIFNGSAGRPPREHADVTLVLADAAGRAPGVLGKDDVLEVTRRIRRGAGSTYRINNKEVRAKDVQLLFADAATGANSPALVRQGQVSDLIAAKPENRRRILEDAAGIAGLHARRHEADLKLRAAETNLQRLEEILIEIEAQAANLRKQARQAERYRGLAETMRQTEALLIHRRWTDARAGAEAAAADLREAERIVAAAAQEASQAMRAAEAAREALTPLREEEAIAAAVLRRLEGVRVGLERDIAEADAAIARADGEQRRLDDEQARLEAALADAAEARARLERETETLGTEDETAAHAQRAAADEELQRADGARAGADARLEALVRDAAEARARADALASAARQAEQRRARLQARLSEVDAQRAALPDHAKAEGELAALAQAEAQARAARDAARAQAAAAEAQIADAEREHQGAWAALREAENTERQLAAEIRALEKVSAPPATRYAPVHAEIEVEPGYEAALAAALGDELEASRDGKAPARWTGARIDEIAWPDGVTPLAEVMTAPPELAARLARIGVCDDGATLIARLPAGVRLVSRAGALWRWDGFVREAGAPTAAAQRLAQRNQIKSARKSLRAAETKLASARAAHEQAQAAQRGTSEALRLARQEDARCAQALAEAAQALARADHERARLTERSQALARERAALVADIAEAEAAAQATPAGEPVDEDALAHARAEAEAARLAAADARATAQGLAREIATRAARRAAIAAERAQWETRNANARERATWIATQRERIGAERAAAADAPEAARAALARWRDEAQTAEARRQHASDAVAQGETAQRNAEHDARAAEAAHAAAREARARAQAHAEAAAQRSADVEHQAREAANLDPEELAGAAGALIASALGRAPLNEVERRLDRLRAERDAGGPVNLRAEEELAECEARLSGLNAEKQDVAAGVAKLRGAITRLNNEGRARLMAAFDVVNAQFAQLFTTLFEGGQAALKLTENEDPLAAGLEIFAQPPGKKLAALSLMSGGEQALTATALIFAVFLANPSPLCVLDEVDAPLDDANVDRFCRLLDEMKKLTATRFLVITHNPVTMARVDRLYGVTMAEPGVSQLVSVDLSAARAMAAA